MHEAATQCRPMQFFEAVKAPKVATKTGVWVAMFFSPASEPVMAHRRRIVLTPAPVETVETVEVSASAAGGQSILSRSLHSLKS
jgi:hypothetical protein